MTTQQKALHTVCDVIMGQAPSGDSYNSDGNGLPLIAGAGDFGAIHPEVKKFTTVPTKIGIAGDIILGIRASIGAKVVADRDYCLGRGVAALRPKPQLSERYLWHWLDEIQAELISKARGATFLQVNRQDIRDLEIPLPPLAEQKRIAGILDAADALRAKRRAALAQLDALAQSLFLDLFGDPVTNPKGWEVVPFHRVGTFVSGSTPTKDRDDFWAGDIPWVSPKDMKRDYIGESIDTISEKAIKETNIKLIEKGHVLIVVRGMILAHSFPVAVNTRSVTFNQDMKAIRPSPDFDSVFLLNCFQNAKRAILAKISEAGHGTKKFDQKSMESITIPKPPLPLQQQFAAAVEAIERQKVRHREQLAGLDALFASLQHRAFRGEL